MRTDKHGVITGAKPFTRGHLYALLGNPLYIGKVRHKEYTYDGQHAAIINQTLREQVQATLKVNAVRRRTRPNARSPSLLAGLIHDESGQALCPSHANKAGKRYRYYVSKALKAGDADTGWRLPAPIIEGGVQTLLAGTFGDDQALMAMMHDLGTIDLRAEALPDMLARGRVLAEAIGATRSKPAFRLYHDIIKRITISKTTLAITLHGGIVAKRLGITGVSISDPELGAPVCIKRRGHEMKMVVGNDQEKPNLDPRLIRLVAQAYDLKSALAEGRVKSIDEYAAKEKIDHGDARRLVPLGTLAPDIVETIMQGRQPVDLTVSRLRQSNQLPLLWSEQRHWLGFAQNQEIH